MPAHTTGHRRERLGADAEDRAAGAAAPHRGEHAERHAEQHGDDERHDPERHRHASLLGEFARDARPRQQRASEVAPEDAADPLDVLPRQRLVEPEPLPDRLDLLGGAVDAGDQLRDVTGKNPEREEDQHAGDEQPEQQQGQSRQRVSDHPSLLASSARLRRSLTLMTGMPVMPVPTATTEAPL